MSDRGCHAVHEAGHAVMAFVLGEGIKRVTINTPPQTELSEAFTARLNRRPVAREDAVRMVLFAVAGGVYEDMGPLYDAMYPDSLPSQVSVPDVSDVGSEPNDDVRWMLGFAAMIAEPKEARDLIARLKIHSVGMLRRNRKGADAIAAALLRRSTLTDAEARSLWEANGGEVEPPESWSL